MKEIYNKVALAQDLFRKVLSEIKETGGLSRDRYIRFLSMQYHLNKGVQKHFYTIASNLALAKKPSLRKWLIQFATEEEFHFEIAMADLKALDAEPLPMPLDTKLWWLFFDSVVSERPFIRLGATCILENITSKSGALLDELINGQDYLNPKNLRYLIIHRHGPNLDHGNQVLDMLSKANLINEELEDISIGAEITTTFYLRAAHWVVTGEALR